VNWLAVKKDHPFKAIVSKEGWADEWLMAGAMPADRVDWMFGGTPLMVPQNYQKTSAIFHALGATIPTLFLMGNPSLGGSEHFGTVRWLYHALKEQGVPTQYVEYPDEGHVFQRPENLRDAFERVDAWFAKFLL